MDRLEMIWGRIAGSTLARNAGWMFLGQSLSVVFQAAYFILVGRLLGSSEYGIYVGAVATVSIVAQYSPLGSNSVLLRYVSPHPERFAQYWGNLLLTTSVLGSALVGILTRFGPDIAHAYTARLIFFVAVSECIFAQFTAAAARVFQAHEQWRLTAGMSLLVNLLRALMAATLLWRVHHATALNWAMAALVASAIATGLALFWVQKLYGSPVLRLSLLRTHVGEGAVFAISYSTTGIYNDADKAMLGHYGLTVANGIYTMAYRVVDVGTMPVLAVQGAAFPRFFQRGVDGIRSTSEYAAQIIRRTAPLALFSSMVLFFASPLCSLAFGAGFRESASALRWLCFLPVLRSFHLSAGDALTAAGHQKLRLASQATAAALNVGANLYLIPAYTWRGAAWASLATDGILAMFNWSVLLLLAKRKMRSKALDAKQST